MRYLKLHLKDHFPFLGDNGKDPTVTIYSPTNMDIDKCTDAKRPCLVLCPGGGYSRISPREAEPLALDFFPLGYHIFILEYTPGPDHNFPTQLREVAAVLELIHENSDEWLCDTERVALMGFSAGGHLAAHYSNAYDWPEVREVFPDSHGVQACILGYPVIIEDGVGTDIIFGDLKEGYVWNFGMDVKVDRDESAGFRTGSVVYRGMCLGDGAPTGVGLVRYTKAT